MSNQYLQVLKDATIETERKRAAYDERTDAWQAAALDIRITEAIVNVQDQPRLKQLVLRGFEVLVCDYGLSPAPTDIVEIERLAFKNIRAEAQFNRTYLTQAEYEIWQLERTIVQQRFASPEVETQPTQPTPYTIRTLYSALRNRGEQYFMSQLRGILTDVEAVLEACDVRGIAVEVKTPTADDVADAA